MSTGRDDCGKIGNATMAGQKATETGTAEEVRTTFAGSVGQRLGVSGLSAAERAEESDATLLEALDLISEIMETHVDRWNLLLDNVEDNLVEMGAQRDLVAPDAA